MWIRSQNHYILANVNSLRICKCDIDGCTYYSIHGHYDRYEQELGIYSSKEKALKDNWFYALYDDMVLIKQALIERDRKIYGLQQHNRNLEDKLGRIGGYHYGNPKQ